MIMTVALIGLVFSHPSSAEVLWCEDFEGDVGANWHVDKGVWEVCPSTHDGKCIATVCDGNYPNNANSRAIRHSAFDVPLNNPRLSFWHWFRTYSTADYGKVQIRVEGGEWEDAPVLDTDLKNPYYYHNSAVWSWVYLDLSAWAGQTVQIAFLFHSDGAYVQTGWYIDDVCMEFGPYDFGSPEGWELGQRDWNVSRGVWEVGDLESCHTGENCAGTVLAGDYSNSAHTRLMTPPFDLPEDNPRLSFWHWFRTYSTADYGKVQIRVFGETDWRDIAGPYNLDSGAWTNVQVIDELVDYAGQTVQIAFLFHSDGAYVQTGWYIDDVEISSNGGPLKIDIKANGQPGFVFTTPGERVAITVSLDPGKHQGIQCDWWVGALTPSGPYWYHESEGWQLSKDPIVSHQGGLFPLREKVVLDVPLYEVGCYAFFFTVDNPMDEVFDLTRGDIVHVVCSEVEH
jgi:hypothetical protein